VLVGDVLSDTRDSAPGDTTLGNILNTLVPTYKETLLPVPLPTFQGRSLIHRENLVSSSSTPCDNSGDTSGKDFSWSRGLGLESSPIKTRSAQKKANSAITLPITSTSDSSDLGALRGIKALARSRS
jgi:hypothetical protein